MNPGASPWSPQQRRWLQALGHAVELGLLGEVGLQHFHLHARLFAQLDGQVFQAVLVAGDQQQVMAPLGKAPGIGGTDTGGCASDQGNALVLLFAHGSVSGERAWGFKRWI